MSEKIDIVVIGAGVIGLSIARTLALSGRSVIVVEQENAIGTHTSSRNSEVIHAGIYYTPNSLKALLCVRGNKMLYKYAKERGIIAKPVGKLIVATSENEISKLQALQQNAVLNGVNDLELLNKTDIKHMEPKIRAKAALFSPSSGIVDSHAYMLSLQGDLENAGGIVVFNCPVNGGHVDDTEITIFLGGKEPMSLRANMVVNAAGLWAPDVCRKFIGFPTQHIPKSYFARGNYFSLSGIAPPFTHLIYPVPEEAGLGIHATLDLAGRVRFGPDVEWIDGIDYTINANRGDIFYSAIRKYWPELKDGSLSPSYSGIRPKITGPGVMSADFIIQNSQTHGVSGFWNLFGIESPGLTSSLAIAEIIALQSRSIL
jgi:L-2-hydroxyglutarate oxidase LhgO